MAHLYLRKKSRSNWVPASYTANETATVISVNTGDLLPGWCVLRVRTVFNGAGTDAIIIVGDGDDDNGLLEAGQADETTVGLYRGAGAYHATAPKLYTAADTVDIGFTANTSGTRTTGAVDLMVPFYSVDPY